ncbi:MAG: branched-chain amino acid ABC transporter substrate-binding protein [Acidovorax sp.]|uniref:branched-chain amino acid ABC transporter substrate-binding protein n=1 Tax=Acidovorax sp. TaxID=1872122 RepID=UPI00391C5388
MKTKIYFQIAALISIFSNAANAQETATVKIGHAGPLSGPQAHYGRDNENGVRMAIEDLNAQKLKIGGKNIKFEVIGEDDAGDPRQGTAVAQKLCDAKVNGVVGHQNSGTSIPASKIYNDCGIPHITGSATNPNLTKPRYKTTYRIIANDNSLGAAIALYAADTLNLKKVAIIDDRTAYGQGVAEVFKRRAIDKGISIVDEQYTNDKTTDFMAVLTSIKGKSPDAIFFGGMDPQAGPMLRQMEQLGMANVKFFGGDGICTEEVVKLAGGAKTVENVVCAEGGVSLAKMTGGEAWKKRYDAKFPGQFQIYSPYTYDATMVLVDAMKRANSTDPKVYISEISKTIYSGVTSAISFDANGELKNPLTTLSTYKSGKKMPLN